MAPKAFARQIKPRRKYELKNVHDRSVLKDELSAVRLNAKWSIRATMIRCR